MSVLNLNTLSRSATACDKWAGLTAILDQFHSQRVYTPQAVAPIHNMVKTLREESSTKSQKDNWHKICKMLRHPKLVKVWSEVLQAPAYRKEITFTTLKHLSSYDPTVSLDCCLA